MTAQWDRLLAGLLEVYGLSCPSEHVVPRVAVLLSHGSPLYLRQLLAPVLSEGDVVNQFLRLPCDDELNELKLESVLTLLRHGCIHNPRTVDLGIILLLFHDSSNSLRVRILAAQLLADLAHLPVFPLFESLRGNGDDLEKALVSFTRVKQRRKTDVSPRLLQVLVELCPQGVQVDDLFLPSRGRPRVPSALVETNTTRANRRRLSSALLTEFPILLYGELGCGKSSLIRALAETLGQGEHLVELFIDSQTDARSLLGAYVCSDIPGEFIWRNGRLSKPCCVPVDSCRHHRPSRPPGSLGSARGHRQGSAGPGGWT